MRTFGNLKFRDRGWSRILRNVERLESTKTKVGVLGNDAARKHPSRGVTVGQVMLWNEYGARNHQGSRIPARMPLRRTFDKSNPILHVMGRGVAERVVLLGQTATSAMRWMGEQAVDAVRTSIAKGLEPGNAARTIKRKGFDHPLIETGLLWASITYRLFTRGGGGADKSAYDELVVDGVSKFGKKGA